MLVTETTSEICDSGSPAARKAHRVWKPKGCSRQKLTTINVAAALGPEGPAPSAWSMSITNRGLTRTFSVPEETFRSTVRSLHREAKAGDCILSGGVFHPAKRSGNGRPPSGTVRDHSCKPQLWKSSTELIGEAYGACAPRRTALGALTWPNSRRRLIAYSVDMASNSDDSQPLSPTTRSPWFVLSGTPWKDCYGFPVRMPSRISCRSEAIRRRGEATWSGPDRGRYPHQAFRRTSFNSWKTNSRRLLKTKPR